MFKQNVLVLRGFTLIELLIVITIIGILIVGLVPRIVGAPAKARDATRLSDLSQTATALEGAFSDQGTYPDPNTTGGAVCSDNAALATALKSYIRTLLVDPQTENPNSVLGTNCKGKYVYEPLWAAGQTSGPFVGFILIANVEVDQSGNSKDTTLATPAEFAFSAELDDVSAVPSFNGTEGEYYYLVR